MTVYVYGDSNTSDWPSKPNPGIPWPARLGTRLVGDALSSERVVNRAIGGQRMHFCRGQAAVPGATWPAIETYAIDDLANLPVKPTAVILCAGTNDIPLETTPDNELPDLVASFEVFEETLRERWGIPLFVVSVVPMRVTGMVSQPVYNERDARRRALNQSLRTRFAPNGRFIDADTVLCDQSGQLLAAASYGDGLHLNAFGRVLIADLIPLAPFVEA